MMVKVDLDKDILNGQYRLLLLIEDFKEYQTRVVQ